MRVAPVVLASTPAARVIPGVCAVCSPASAARTTRTPPSVGAFAMDYPPVAAGLYGRDASHVAHSEAAASLSTSR